MNIETALSDAAFDLPVPPDGLDRVRRQASRLRRRRHVAMAVPGIALVALLVPAVAPNGADRTSLYGSPSPSPAQTRGPVNQTLQTFCELPGGDRIPGRTDLIGPTGDPVDNCQRYWRHAMRAEPPALIAYQNEFGDVVVQPKHDPLPSDAVVLPPGARQATEAILLEEALGDPIGLGPDHCRTRQEAIVDATRVVARMGFKGWPVRVDDSRAVPTGPHCWSFAPSTRHHDIRVVAIEGRFDYPATLEQIAKPLRRSLTECWSRAKALTEVKEAVASSDLKQEFKDLVYIRQVDEPGRRCTLVRMGGGGGIELTLRGPV